MKLKLIACKVLQRELSYLSALSSNFIDVTYLRQGYHENPTTLKEALQKEIDRIDNGDDPYSSSTTYEDFDAILIGYGLCSNGIIGLKSKKYKLVFPKAHDCVTLFLGSKEKYREYFNSHKGVYWYTQGWIENSRLPNGDYDSDNRKLYESKGYDEDTVEYLLEESYSWIKNYSRAVYIHWKDLCLSPQISEYAYNYTQKAAKDLGWDFDVVDGEPKLLTDFIDGNWDDENFLVVNPNEIVAPSFDESIIKSISTINE